MRRKSGTVFFKKSSRGLRGKTLIQVNHHEDTKYTKKRRKIGKDYELFPFSL